MHSPNSSARSSATPRPSWALIAACAICAASLPGCGATLPTSRAESSELPSRPSLSTPLPVQPYSKQWQQEVDAYQKLVQESRDKLKATQLMSKPSGQPGP